MSSSANSPPMEISCSSQPSSKNVSLNTKDSNEKSQNEKQTYPKSEKDLLTRYNELLDTNPVITKSVTSAFISALGSALGSYISSQKQKRKNMNQKQQKGLSYSGGGVNWLDVLAFSSHGGFIGGPVGHYWFDWLSKQKFSTLKSTLIDQILVQPPLLVFMFLFIDSSKAAVREIKPSLSRTLSTIGPTVVNSWKFWPFAVWFTFRYLKKKHYTVALNLCSLAWTIYLSKSGGGE